MIYVFDDNSLSNILNFYYTDRFPSFWEKFNEMIREKRIISVREVKFELLNKFNDEQIERLTKRNKNFFENPSPEELAFITKIYSVKHFQQNLDKKKLLHGGYFADPFIIAKAWKVKGTVITEETFKENAVRIPNICEHFEIEYGKLENFLIKEDWKF